MADDMMMLDQAMDVDSNVPVVPVPVTANPDPATATTTTNRNPLRGRRNIPNPRENRGRPHEPLKTNPSARIHKSYAQTYKNNQAFIAHVEEGIRARGRIIRKHKIARAMADGTFQIPHDTRIISQAGENHAEQLRRLDARLVAAALFDPVPGMAFDRAAPCAFTNDTNAMADLVQALEAFQVHLARKGMPVVSERAGALLRALARDVLRTMLLLLPGPAGADASFWAAVARNYTATKKLRWLASRVGLASPDYVMTVLEAVERPGSHPDVEEALRSVISEMPSFIKARPSTLQALMGHFEAARARYLASLRDDAAHGTTAASRNTASYQAGAMGFGRMMPSSGDGGYDSSDDEEDGGHPRGGIFDGGAEDERQVEGGVPSGLGQWFLVNLDRFTASRGGQQQGVVDADMLSALDLGGTKSNL